MSRKKRGRTYVQMRRFPAQKPKANSRARFKAVPPPPDSKEIQKKRWVKKHFGKGSVCLLMEKVTDDVNKTSHHEMPCPCKVVAIYLGQPIRLQLKPLVEYPKLPGWLVDEVCPGKGHFKNDTTLSLSFRDTDSLVKHVSPIKPTRHLTTHIYDYVTDDELIDLTMSVFEEKYHSLGSQESQCPDKNCKQYELYHLIHFSHP